MHACGLRNSECHVCIRLALAGRRRSEIEKPRGPRTAPDRAKGLEEDERGLQMEEESVVFSNIKVRVKRAAPSGLGDLEVTEYIARIRGGPFETRRERRICPPGND